MSLKLRLRRRTRKGAEQDNAQMTLMDHLRELRTRIVKCAIAAAVGGVIVYVFYTPIFNFFTHPYVVSSEGLDKDSSLITTEVAGGFLLRVKVAGYGGLILAVPVILWQLWRFVVPGLYRNERRYTVAFVASSVVLFTLGGVLAYLTLPPMLRWLITSGGPVVTVPRADNYFWLSALMMAAFGIGFEFPLVLVALQMVGVVDNAQLRAWRRYAAVLIVVVVAFLTPGGDPISLVALSVPMYLFYEAAILLGWLMARRRTRRDAVDPAPAGTDTTG